MSKPNKGLTIFTLCLLFGCHSVWSLQAAPVIDDTPKQHNMFLLGSESLFAAHMPMFTKEEHMYQVILEVSFSEDALKKYHAYKAANAISVPNFVNSDQNLFTLPALISGEVSTYQADLYGNYTDSGPNDLIAEGVQIDVKRNVLARHFDFNFDYPKHLAYLIFGKGDDVFMAHYISRPPDFQHLLKLKNKPEWLSEPRLATGVQIDIVDIPGNAVPCAQPLTESSYRIQIYGMEEPTLQLDLSESQTAWYSTGNLLNPTDPCPE